MHDRRKTKKELRAELANLRQRVAVLESNGSPSRADRGRAAADRDRPDDSPWQSPSVAASNGALLERLRDSEERFRLAFEHSPLGMSILDLEGRYQKVNRAWCRMMGYAAEEVLGKPVGFLAHPDDHHRWWGETQDVLHGKRPPLTAEVRYRTKAGTFLWTRVTGAVICDARGVPRYALGMLEDITERRRAAEQVQREQHLLRQLLDLHEGYRKLIAYEIHDGLAQDLAAAHLNLQSYEQLRESQPDTARTALATGMRLLAGGIAECRRLISGLRPPILDEAGVVGAIEFLVCEAQGAGGRSVAFVNRTHFRRLAAPLENGLFRIVQEALTNAIRHSNSPVVRVTLDDDQARLKLEVRDWGVGFDPAAVPDQHFGLRGIRERARLLGGRAAIASQPGAGTQIDVDLPLVPAAEPTAGA